MNAHTPISDAADWARPYLDRQLALLGELAESGLEIARAVERQASGKAGDGPPICNDVALAYARVSRAVRQTVALQARLIADRQAFEAGVIKDRVEAAKQRDYHRIFDVPKQIQRAERMVWRIAAEENPDDLETAERLANEAAEQLKDQDIYGDILTRPFSEIIAEICLDLGLEPNWGALSNEQWAQAEIASGNVGEPLAQRKDSFPLDGGRVGMGVNTPGCRSEAEEASTPQEAFPTASGEHPHPTLPPRGGGRGPASPAAAR